MVQSYFKFSYTHKKYFYYETDVIYFCKFQLIKPMRKIGIIDDKARTTAADMFPNIDENTFPNIDAHIIIPDKWNS